MKTKHVNKKMNENVFKLRRKVMNFVYEAKKIYPQMPRITIRITDCNKPEVLGTAGMNRNIIWIPESTLSKGDSTIRHVVFHELCHAIWGIQHNEKCPLMKTFLTIPCSKRQCYSIFKKYMKENELSPYREISFIFAA